MDTEKILEKQVDALEKLLQLKQAIIDELELRITKMSPGGLSSGGSTWSNRPVPSFNKCVDGGPHLCNYNTTSGAICAKCGRVFTSTNFTSSNNATIPSK